MVDLVGEGSDINGATPSSFFSIGASVSIVREILCLPYAGFYVNSLNFIFFD